LFNSLTWCLTKTVKPKLETSIFWCLQGFFPNSLKKEAHYCSEQKGEGDTHPELPGKEEGEAEGWGRRELLSSTHEGLLVTTAVQVHPAQGQHWSTGRKGWPTLLGHRNHKGSIRDLIVCLPQTRLEGSKT
jgi:hypothetical protein